MDTVKAIKGILRECEHVVDRECAFIVFDGIGEDAMAADVFRKHHAIGNCPDTRTAIIYEVGASGAAAFNPSRNPPPFRKEHCEALVHAALHRREEGFGAKAQAISNKFFYDCKKQGDHSKMEGLLAHNKQKMQMAHPKQLMNVFQQASAEDRSKRVSKAFAPLHSQAWQTTLVISRETLGTNIPVID